MNPPSRSDEIARVNEIRNRFVASFEAGAVEGLMDLYAEDYVDMSAGSGTRDRKGMRQAFEETFASYQTSLRIHPEEVLVNGTWALERGTFELQLMPKAGGKPETIRRRYLEILQKHPDGSWKIFRDLDNDLPPGPAQK